MDEQQNNAERTEENVQPNGGHGDLLKTAVESVPDRVVGTETDYESDDRPQAGGHESDSGVDSKSVEMPQGPGKVQPAEFGDLDGGVSSNGASANIELLMDVNLPVAIELGRTQMSIKDILELVAGSIVELDKLAGEPVDILVNSRPLAKGEVVVLDEHFGVRITSLVSPRERLENLGA